MTPSAATRFQPALAALQSFSALRERQSRAEAPGLPSARPALEPPAPKDMRAINDYYFGNHLTTTEAMARLFEKLVGSLNAKLDLGRDGDPEGVAQGEAWRSRMLRDDAAAGGPDDFAIPQLRRDGASSRDAALAVASKFDLDALSLDSGLKKELEQVLGFRLDGMSVKDLVEAFTDPDGDSAAKVRAVVSEGLAGSEGSKASERLKAAAKGPKTAEEMVRDVRSRSGREETVAETLAEDLKTLDAAKAQGKLEAARESRKRLNDLAADAEETQGAKAGPQSADPALAAIALLVAEKSGATTETSEQREPAEPEAGVAGLLPARREAAEPEGREERISAAIERFYRLADASRDAA